MFTVDTMIKCNEAYKNEGWVITSDENRLVGFVRSLPADNLQERIHAAITSFFDGDGTPTITNIVETRDNFHDISVSLIPEYIEEPTEAYAVTYLLYAEPCWEY